jgi:hypothetical protein
MGVYIHMGSIYKKENCPYFIYKKENYPYFIYKKENYPYFIYKKENYPHVHTLVCIFLVMGVHLFGLLGVRVWPYQNNQIENECCYVNVGGARSQIPRQRA